MRRKIILPVFFCLLFLSATSEGLFNSPIFAGIDIQFVGKPVIADQNIIFVPQDYSKIQNAIDAANPDDVIKVKAGTYYEALSVYKPLTIMGEDKNATIIVGRVTVGLSNHVVVRGFTIRNAPSLFCGITVYSNSNVISENIIKNNGEDGIWLWYNTRNNTISHNIIERNTFCGISLDDSTDNMISENFIANHQHGMMITNSENNTMIGNTFMNNSHCGVHLDSSNNVIYHNNFVNSPVHSHDSTNTWDNSVEGNYWSDYEEKYPDAEEIDDSGIWDTPYEMDGDNQDNYPLTHPWGSSPTISIISPENKTYPVEDIPLIFIVSQPTSWIGYSLDGQANVTITGNTTLSGLSDGSYSLIVYARNTAGNTGASEMVYFSIEIPQHFPTEIAAVVGIIAIVGAVVFVYFTKFKK